MKCLLFGTGDYYNRYKHWFKNGDVLALLDNSCEKVGTYIDDIMVLSPEDGLNLSYDCIIVLSFYIKEMRKQLIDLGVDEQKIIHFFDLYKVINIKDQYEYKLNKNGKKKILLLSQDLELGGPALALMHMAEILIQNDFQIVFGSMIDGPLRSILEKKGIYTIVDNNLQIGTMSEICWTHQFNQIVCNTINYYRFLSDRKVDIPVTWWLHDALFFYDGVDKSILRKISLINLKVLSVGNVPTSAMHTFFPKLHIDELIYGVEDKKRVLGTRNQVNVRFVTIGYIEPRKGQDIIIRAVKQLPEEIRKKAEFYFIGQDNSYFALNLKKEIKYCPEIHVIGPIERDEIDLQLDLADAMICSSREDPMPTVVAEAMMHGKMCIVSDVIGTAKYITHMQDGLIFKSLNIEELSYYIEWSIKHRVELVDMGKNARVLFQQHFSMKVFEQNVLKYIGQVE